ncbi:WD40-repeat-containing domain protein [Mycena epipterygia]|nr:WD40-repeat-containing domain protein [Mycena epipterygia]
MFAKSSRYVLRGSLAGHYGGIKCLAVTEDGKVLASGGSDGVRLWNVASLSRLNRPNGAGNRGTVSALTWIRREEDPGEVLVYGTQCGFVCVWKQRSPTSDFEEGHTLQMTDPAEVTGITFDAATNRLCVCHRNSVVQSYTMDRTATPQPVFSVSVKNFVPKAISFGEYRGNDRDVKVFGLYNGQIHTMRGGSGEILSTRQIGGMIGDAAINSRKGLFCIDDPFEGAALYRLDDENRVRTFSIAVTKAFGRPRQIRFAEEGAAVVSGSDHGVVYVFETRSGDLLDKLRIGAAEDWLQTIATADIGGTSTIFAARSRDVGGANEIFVWRRGSEGRLAWGKLKVLFQILVVLGCLAFPLRVIRVADDSDDESDGLLYYCEKCDPCPICLAPPPARVVEPTASNVPVEARTRLLPPTVPATLPLTIFLLEVYFLGGWMHLVLPYLIGLTICYL